MSRELCIRATDLRIWVTSRNMYISHEPPCMRHVMKYVHESRTMYMSHEPPCMYKSCHEINIWVKKIVYESKNMCVSPKICIWVLNYVYDPRSGLIHTTNYSMSIHHATKCVYESQNMYLSQELCLSVHRIWLSTYVWYDSFICMTWFIHVCNMTRLYVWHASFICVTWLVHMCNMTHSYVRHDSFTCVTWLLHVRDMTPQYERPVSLICVTWLMHVWCDTFICVVCVMCDMSIS